jgi:hypothetical protein
MQLQDLSNYNEIKSFQNPDNNFAFGSISEIVIQSELIATNVAKRAGYRFPVHTSI